MWDDDVLRTFAAAADTIKPGSSTTGRHLKVIGLFDHAMKGLPILVAGLLDAFATDVRPETSFTDLTEEERGEVFKLMSTDDGRDVRDAVDGLFLFVIGQSFSEEAPGRDELWQRLGYHGPSDGIPNYG